MVSPSEFEEMRTTAAALRTHMVGESVFNQRLWVFTSQENYALAEAGGTVSMLERLVPWFSLIPVLK